MLRVSLMPFFAPKYVMPKKLSPSLLDRHNSTQEQLELIWFGFSTKAKRPRWLPPPTIRVNGISPSNLKWNLCPPRPFQGGNFKIRQIYLQPLMWNSGVWSSEFGYLRFSVMVCVLIKEIPLHCTHMKKICNKIVRSYINQWLQRSFWVLSPMKRM